MPIPHPIPYQGSKRNLAAQILPYLPDDTNHLIEPFAGSAAISIAAAYHRQADAFILNDINAPLMALWQHIIQQPQSLANRYERLWHLQLQDKRQFYDLVRQRFNQTHRPFYLLYLLARCVKASVRYNANGEFNQSPDNRRKGRKPDTMRKDILQTSALLSGKTKIYATDYRNVLQDIQQNDVVYMDPPYQGVQSGRDPRYLHALAYDDFCDTLHDLNKRNISYLVSYDGRTGNKSFGKRLPNTLNLTHIELDAGRSSQATLLGRADITVESLYLSPALVERYMIVLSSSHASRQIPENREKSA